MNPYRMQMFLIFTYKNNTLFCRFTEFTKMQLTSLLDGRSVSDKLFFKMKYEGVL